MKNYSVTVTSVYEFEADDDNDAVKIIDYWRENNIAKSTLDQVDVYGHEIHAINDEYYNETTEMYRIVKKYESV